MVIGEYVMDRITGQITPLYFFNPVGGEIAPLHLTLRLDGQTVYDQPVIQPDPFDLELDDSDGEHTLEFELLGRGPEHTVYNIDGQIVCDSCVSIRNLKFNDVDLNPLLYKLAHYEPSSTELFHGALKSNVLVKISFTTPVDLWLFEHM